MPNLDLSDAEITRRDRVPRLGVATSTTNGWPPRPILVSGAAGPEAPAPRGARRAGVQRPGGARRGAVPLHAPRLLRLPLRRAGGEPGRAHPSPASPTRAAAVVQRPDYHGSGHGRGGLHPRVDPRAQRLHRARRDVLGRRPVADAGELRARRSRRPGGPARGLPDDASSREEARCATARQAVAYPYFVVALLLFGLQMVLGLLSAAKYLGPDPLLNVLPFDVTKEMHTNLLIVLGADRVHGRRVLAGARGVADRALQRRSSPTRSSVLWTLTGVTAVVGYLFGWTTGNKLLEQPLPVKIAIVVVMLMFLYNIADDDPEGGRWTTTEARAGRRARVPRAALPAGPDHFDNYTRRASSTAGGRCTCGSRACGR